MNYTSRIYNFFEYLLSFLIILQCNSIFLDIKNSFIPKLISTPSLIGIAILFLISVVSLLKTNIKSSFNIVFFLLLYIFILFIYLFYEYFEIYKFNFMSSTVIFLFSIPIFTAYFYSVKDTALQTNLFKKIYNIIFILSCISLIFYFLFLFGINPNTTVMSTWTNMEVGNYFYLDFVTQKMSIFGFNVMRNSGIFVEPSIYGFVLLSGFIIGLFFNDKSKFNLAKTFIIFIAILSTTSTTAIIIAILSIILFIILKNKNAIMFFIGIPVIGIGYYFIHVLYSAKKSIDIYSSYGIRMNDMYACLQAWKYNIWAGTGIDNNSYIINHLYFYRIMWHFYGQSLGFFCILAYGGLMLMMFYMLPSLLIIFKNKRLFIVSICINSYLLFAMIQTSYLYAIFIAYFWSMIIGIDKKV